MPENEIMLQGFDEKQVESCCETAFFGIFSAIFTVFFGSFSSACIRKILFRTFFASERFCFWIKFFSVGGVSQLAILQKIIGKSVIVTQKKRLLGVALPLLKPRLVLPKFCRFEGVSAAAIRAAVLWVKVASQNSWNLLEMAPINSSKLRIITWPGAQYSLGFHPLKNVAARPLVACGPETHSCGIAVGHQN